MLVCAVALALPAAASADVDPGALWSRPVTDSLLADSWCGTPRTADSEPTPDGRHFKVVYAHPSDLDRFATMATPIQQWTKAAAAYVEWNSDKSVRLDRGSSCGLRNLDIQSVTLPGDAARYRADPYAVQDVRSLLPTVRGRYYLVYADVGAPDLTAFAEILADDRRAADNLNNGWTASGQDRSALAFYVSGATANFFPSDQTPERYESVVLHELLHTLGAVQSSAPHFSGGSHCYQLSDVMCYTPRDGTTGEYANDCPQGVPLDCGQDDYFNPSPPAGSYLATHWNTYDSAFLCPLARCGDVRRAPAPAPVPDPEPAPPVAREPEPPFGGSGLAERGEPRTLSPLRISVRGRARRRDLRSILRTGLRLRLRVTHAPVRLTVAASIDGRAAGLKVVRLPDANPHTVVMRLSRSQRRRLRRKRSVVVRVGLAASSADGSAFVLSGTCGRIGAAFTGRRG